MKKKYFAIVIGILISAAIILTLGIYKYNNLDYSQKYMFQLKKARSLLKDKESKEVFDFGVDVFNKYFKEKKSNENYLPLNEYIKSFNPPKVSNDIKDFDKNIKEGSTLIDGGVLPDGDIIKGFYGYVGPNGKIIIFEPSITNIQKAKENVTNHKNVEIYPFGLWSSKKTMKLWVYDEPRFNSVKVHNSSNSYVNADFIKLDDFTKEKNLQKLDYLRLNIQGSEYEALLGAKETIKKFKPEIYTCLYVYPIEFFSIILYLDSLNLNYKFRMDAHIDSSVSFYLYAFVDD